MMNTVERLVYMANQIARNLGALDFDAAAEATAGHIADYWDPRMKAQIFAVDPAEAGLSDVAARAVAILRAKAA